MLTVAYLANLYPSPLEPYVEAEIGELRSRGVRVISGSVRKAPAPGKSARAPEIILMPLSPVLLLQALWLSIRGWNRIAPFLGRVLFRGSEGPLQRLKALTHTWLGACYAVRLKRYEVDHIHVHHGYFGSWVAMTAAQLLDVEFSMTLHGSDVLLHGTYLDLKLQHCISCFTVSDHNRRYILERYPAIDSRKVIVSRLGVEITESSVVPTRSRRVGGTNLNLLAVGRLHAVKDHAFLVRACARLAERGVHFECSIAGDGPERRKLKSLIRKLGLESRITLLGHVAREQMDSLYDRADVVVLTSRSEGIPLVLMEAMARGKLVLAPDITGIPELVIARKTGFLYLAGCMVDFIDRLVFIHSLIRAEDHRQAHAKDNPFLLPSASVLDWMRHAARGQVHANFNRTANLKSFGDSFVPRIASRSESLPHENFVLQQI
jgi:colanic acid/amylovoran biosynthesis glycosyltransferase